MKALILTLLLAMPALGNLVTVQAGDKKAVRFAKLESGDVVTIQYKSGEWKRRDDLPLRNPDTTKAPECKVIIFHEDANGKKTIIASPTGTAYKPFEFTVKTAGNYYIRMEKPLETGSGIVVYSIESR